MVGVCIFVMGWREDWGMRILRLNIVPTVEVIRHGAVNGCSGLRAVHLGEVL